MSATPLPDPAPARTRHAAPPTRPLADDLARALAAAARSGPDGWDDGGAERESARVLLHARGDDLEQLCALARPVRDEAMRRAGRPGTITYSRKVFVPITRLCRDRCHYCTFATVPGRLPVLFLSEEDVLAIAREGAAMGCKEALFTLGDAPEDRWPAARAWLSERGFSSTLEYVQHLARRVLDETGLLPHLNPGVMSFEALTASRPLAPSMGMMLETTSGGCGRNPVRSTTAPPTRTPSCGCGCCATPAGRASRSPAGCCWASGRRPPSASTRSWPCATSPARRRHPGGHRPELPGEGRHRDAR